MNPRRIRPLRLEGIVEQRRLLNWFEIDEARWPEVRCTFRRVPSNDEFAALLERVALYVRRGEPHAYILDLRAVELPSPARRAALLKRLRVHEPQIADFVVGVALILAPAAQPFVKSAMLLARSAMAPCAILDSVETARRWCGLQLGRNALGAIKPRRATG